MKNFYQKSSGNSSFRPLKHAITLILLSVAAGMPLKLFAQPLPFDVPTISYSSPQVYTAGTAITQLVPTSSGVAALAYSSSAVTFGSGFVHPHGVAVDATGNVYVADASNNAIKKIPVGGGAPVTLGSGFNFPFGVAVDAAGNVYVADFGNNAVKKIPAGGGAPVTLASGFNSPSSVAVDAAGNVYVADENNRAIKEIPAGGGPTVTIGPQFGLPSGVAVDAAGNVYVAELVAHAVKEMPPGGGSPVTIGTGFNSPVAVTVDAAGNVYVADFDSMIEKIPAVGGSWGAIASGFSRSDGVAIDGAGNIYVTDQDSDAVKEIKPVGGYFISKPLPAGLQFDEHTGIISGTPLASISSPATDYYITAYNASGNATAKVTITINPIPVPAISYSSPQVYVTGTAITPLSLTNTGGGAAPAGYRSTATAISGFNAPQDIALDAAGNLYVVDLSGSAIFKLPAGGGAPTQVLPAGYQGAVSSQNIAVDAAGNIYTYNSIASSILKIPADGPTLTLASGLTLNSAIAVDVAGNVYGADVLNGGIVKIPARGGTPVMINTGFNTPTDIVLDAAGNIFFNSGSSIFKIPAGGGALVNVPIPFPFSGETGSGLAIDGVGNLFVPVHNSVIEIPVNGGTPITINAGFSTPRWLAVNAANELYVSGTGTNLVYKVTPTGGYYINPALPAGLSFDTATGLISGTPTQVSPAKDYRVTVYNTSGGGSAAVSITVNPLPPTVSSFSPASGPVGTLVTINGTNLSNPATLTIGGQNAIAVSNTGSVLVAMVMPGTVAGGVTFSTAGGAAAVSGTFTITATPFPSAQQGAKLIAAGNIGSAQDGTSIAISADGNTAIAGGPADNSGQGAAWIYTRSNGVWTQQGPKLVGAGNVGAAAQGSSVAISADGNTAIIGGPGDNNQQGAVWIFTRSGGAWTQQGTKLSGWDNLGPASQGFAVSISADGNTAVSGGFNDQGGLGATWVFTRIAGGWAQQGLKLTASDAAGPANQGYSVAISADATTILAGAPGNAGNIGGAWFYTRNGDTWSQVGHQKQGANSAIGSRGGTSVALSADGNTGIIGAAGNNGGQGSAWVFFRLGPDWSEQLFFDNGTDSYGLVGSDNTGAAAQGSSVALSADGSTAMVGGPADNANTGAAWIYRNAGIWIRQGSKIVGTGYTGAARQFSSLALSADGTTAVSGGPADNSGQGAAWAYIVLATPTAQATNVTFTNTTVSSTTASWTNGNGTSSAVFMSAAAGGSPAPVDNTVYTANAAFGSGTQIGSSGWYCVYNGAGNTVNITGLTQGTTYGVMAIEYNSGAGSIKYLTTQATGNPNNVTTLALPTISYSSPQTYIAGTAITPLVPTSSGVAAPGYSGSRVDFGSGFNFPFGVAADAAGNVYVTDPANNAVYKVPAGGGPNVTIGSGFSVPAAVAVDVAGNVYVADNSTNLITKIPVGGGPLVTLGSGFNSPSGIAVDVAGNVYVADTNNSAVKMIPAGGGSLVTLGSGFTRPYGVALDGAGNVYVADSHTNLITKIPVGGGPMVTLGSGFSGPTAIALDIAGNVYVADAGNHAVKMIPIGGGSPIAIGGSAFIVPNGVAVDPAGNVYVTDLFSFKVKEIKPVGGYYISPALPAGLNFDGATGIISGTPTMVIPAKDYHVTAYNSGGGSSATVNIKVIALSSNANLAGLAISAGALNPSFASGTTSYTAVVSKSTTSITITPTVSDTTATIKVNGIPVHSGSASNAIVLVTGANVITTVVKAQDSTTTKTYTVTVTRLGNLPYVSYSGPQGYLTGVTIVPLVPASFGVAAPGYSNILVNIGSGFSNPDGLATDLAGNVYVADFGNNLVKKIPAGGGSPVSIGSGFVRPTAVAVDAAGNVYVADYGNSAIKKIPAGGGAPVTLGSGFIGPDGVAVDAAGNVYVADQLSNQVKKIPVGGGSPVIIGSGFSFPTGVAVDPAGNVYVADLFNNAVKKIPAGGGSPVVIGTGFSGPTGVAIDPAGNVYVADYYNNAIKKINVIGGATVVVGSSIHTPFGIAIDASGKVYVSDASDNLVKKITPSGGYYISPALPVGLIFNGNSGSITGKPTMVSPPTNYTVTVYNGFGSSQGVVNIAVVANANLARLFINNGILTPVFAPGTTGYADTVSYVTASVKVSPTTSDANATVKVNGVAVVSGTPSASLPLSVGSNTIKTIVTAVDGTTAKTYTITVVRLRSPNANLANLITNKATLSPLFVPTTTAYTASVGNGLTSIKVLAVAAAATATITVNGSSVASGVASAGIPLSVGPNIISVIVTAPDGTTTKTYTLTITRATGPIPVATTQSFVAQNTADDKIIVHQGISPNGDGQNDVLTIDGITNYPDNKLTIMNRSGALIFEVKGYDNATRGFNGHSNKTGKMQQPGTYFYSLEYKTGGVTKYKTGFLVLKY